MRTGRMRQRRETLGGSGVPTERAARPETLGLLLLPFAGPEKVRTWAAALAAKLKLRTAEDSYHGH